jgi:DNA-directed RNA polymerase subunit RPC12/RpoP
MSINKRRTTVVVPGKRDKTIAQPKTEAPKGVPAGTLCSYSGAPHAAAMGWQCLTCKRWFCQDHWFTNEKNEKNVECSTCAHERLQRR